MTDPASDQSNDGAIAATTAVAPTPARQAPPKKASKSRRAAPKRVATTGVAAGEAAAADDWKPAELGKDGHTLVGKHPFSGPARARSLARAGAKSDPQGLVSDEAIATAAKAAKARKA